MEGLLLPYKSYQSAISFIFIRNICNYYFSCALMNFITAQCSQIKTRARLLSNWHTFMELLLESPKDNLWR